MIRKLTLVLTAIIPMMFANAAHADDHAKKMMADETASMPKIGAPAPAFTATDTNGNEVSLEALKGKVVVLEWTNHECPFVIKHYETKNMQSLQEKAAEMGVTWISIVSSAEGKQGATTAEEANEIMAEQGAKPAHRILDPEGTIGHMYGAKTTPHMFVIDAEGNLAYQGAIDDNPSPRQSAVADAKNYVLEAMTALTTGGEIEVAETRSYGCSVKY
ncbi:MAG: redoxin family protein [Bdellovibrionales bacterium]